MPFKPGDRVSWNEQHAYDKTGSRLRDVPYWNEGVVVSPADALSGYHTVKADGGSECFVTGENLVMSKYQTRDIARLERLHELEIKFERLLGELREFIKSEEPPITVNVLD